MAQATILASAQTAATSTDVVVAAGSQVTIGIFATGAIPAGVQVSVAVDTPGDDANATVLNNTRPNTVISGPGTFRAYRPDISAYGVNVGVFTES